MIFPDLNSLKFATSSSAMENYRNTLYEDITKGLCQRRKYDKKVPTIIVNSGDDIVFQYDTDTPPVYYEVYIYNNGTFTYIDDLDSISDDVEGDIYNATIPISLSGYSYIFIVQVGTSEEYVSEWFYASSEAESRSFDPHLLEIKYKNLDGMENGYYWTGDYQQIKIESAFLTDTDIEVNREVSESIQKEELVLDTSTLEWDEYTITNIPEYLAKKIVKASSQSDVEVRGVPMGYKIHSFTDKRDGRVDMTISFKQVKVKNIY